ncbi:MAG TPA: hypothetical protein VFE24_07400 [Pirellulales bacterium]|jgi:hypothetical protein|nr:hypothetical protein [Pirellulales bacterium]
MLVCIPHRLLVTVPLLLAALCVAQTATAAGPKTHVDMELGFEKGAGLDAQQKWYRFLTTHGVENLRIHQQQPGEQPKIESIGSETAPAFRVFGTISASSALIVPGGNFSLADAAAFEKWVHELGENGAAGVTQKKTAFGLLPQQFKDLHEDLAQKVGFSTKGMPLREFMSKMAGKLKTPFTLEPATKQALAAEDPVRDELEGLTCGTAIAAALRPAGMVLVPRKPSGSRPELLVTPGKGVAEFWPIGWPPEKLLKDMAPVYFEFLNVELDDVTAEDALAALQGRLKVPFLFDYNGLVRAKIDLKAGKIKVPERKTYYLKALEVVLHQANLRHETRVDEAGVPFEWIMPLRGGG